MSPQRAGPRVSTHARAIVTAGSRTAAFTIDSMSISGARLEGPLALMRGQLIEMWLELGNATVQVTGEVVRVDTPDLMTDQVAVRFVDLSPEAYAAIDDAVHKALEDQR